MKELMIDALYSRAELYISAMSVGEIYYITERRLGPGKGKAITSDILQLPLEIQEPNMEQILAAAQIKAYHPLSYADAFVVALSKEKKGTIVTGDPEFRHVENTTKILWLS